MEKSGQTVLRILIADDHPLFRTAIKSALFSLNRHIEFVEAGFFDELCEKLDQLQDLDLILLDLKIPGVTDFSGLFYIRTNFPHFPVVIISGNDDPATIRTALNIGASGFIPKSTDPETLEAALKSILNGHSWAPESTFFSEVDAPKNDEIVNKIKILTPQQMRVLMKLSQGLLNKQIAYELGVSEATIKAHVSAILKKLDVDSRTHAAVLLTKISEVV
ncbi:MAG: response regulator [Hyphomicrobiales bacterium]